MQLLSIGIPNAVSVNSEFIEYGLRNLNKEGINVAVNLNDCGQIVFYNFSLEDKQSVKYIYKIKKYVADVISDIIVNQLDKKVIKNIIKKYYYYFDEEEQKQIIKIANDILDDDINRDTFKLIKKEEIYLLLLDFLKYNNRVNIEGFLNFRLRDFIGELNEIANRAVDEFIIQKEYNEFLGLLRYFVELQDSKIDVLNVVVEDDGTFRFFDSNDKPITEELLKDISIEFNGGELSDEDMLLSTLISIAPEKIFIHSVKNIRNKEIIETIKKVFCERVFICHGCNLCLLNELRKY
ncbi:MAG: putative sporulation protein YtxC [Thermoanaerobacteraceae bacterium]|jgi:putative sporulation protein YtxC|nr:putative sporulation protein YtxC [Thermoanaerobacteraceae bacterium]